MRKLTMLLFLLLMLCPALSVMAADGDYIVILKEAPSVMLMGEDSGIIDREDNVFVVDSLMSAYALAPAENIERIFPDEVAYLTDVPAYPEGTNDTYFPAQWHLPFIGASGAWRNGFCGNGVRVAILDSGIDLNHPDLPEPIYVYNAIKGADETDVQDTLGHGTSVAGVIAAKTNNSMATSSIAHDAQLMIIKVADANQLSTSSIIMGFKKVLAMGCDVINMSLGFTELSAPAAIEPMRELVEKAVDEGIIVVASAGNDGNSAINGTYYQYPASYDNAVSVGSLGDSENRTGVDMEFTKLNVPRFNQSGLSGYSRILSDVPSYFTQRNDRVTCTAPGYMIMTTAKNRSVGTVHGTSFSSPIVAAAAAIAKEINPDITAPEFIQALTETCDDVFTEGYDNYTGYGKLNMNRLVTHLMLENNPSAIPVPESRITRSGNTYNIFYVHGMLGEQSKVYAAIYSDDRLAAIKSADCELGSYASEMEIDFEGELDYAEMFVWSESEHMKYATDKQRIYY